MKFLNATLLAILSINNALAQGYFSINFTIAYEIDTNSRDEKCAKSTVAVNNVDISCLYNLGASTACYQSGYGFAYLPGIRENAIEASKKRYCSGTTSVYYDY